MEALLIGLAEQAGDGSVAATVLDGLARRQRSTVRTILGCAGPLIHYGTDPEVRWLEAVRDQLTSALRSITDPGPHGILPGDAAELIADQPEAHLVAGTPVTVRYVGTDGTTDAEPLDDYVIVTVPTEDFAACRPPQTKRSTGRCAAAAATVLPRSDSGPRLPQWLPVFRPSRSQRERPATHRLQRLARHAFRDSLSNVSGA